MRLIVLAAFLGALSALPMAAIAQGQQEAPMSDEAIARAAGSVRAPTDDEVQRVVKKLNLPAPNSQRLAESPLESPRIEALPAPLNARDVNFGDVAKGYGSTVVKQLAAEAKDEKSGLLVFVSFAIPDKTLRLLVEQAARFKGSVVIRGLVDGSMKKTMERVNALIGSKRVGFLIDPEAFDRFGVDAVPAFVIADGVSRRSCGAEQVCQEQGQFAKVSGDVSVEYALEYFERASPRFGSKARKFRLGQGG